MGGLGGLQFFWACMHSNECTYESSFYACMYAYVHIPASNALFPFPFLTHTRRNSARLRAEELHLLRNYHRLPYANPLLDKYLGEATFEGRRWHVLVGMGSLALNALLLLMVWALQGAVKRRKGKEREKSE